MNPRFITSFVVDYHFESKQRIKVAVYDVDDFANNASLEGHDFVGEVELFLHEIVTAPEQQLKRQISKEGKRLGSSGILVLTAEEKKSKNNLFLEMAFNAVEVNASGPLFFVLNRCADQYGTKFVPTYKSKTTPSTGGVVQWDAVEMLAGTICRDDHNRPICMEVFESRKSGNHRFLGSTKFTLLELLERRKTRLDIVTKDRRSCGVEVTKCLAIEKNTFLDYVFGGCEISLIIALDFTLSNGEPTSPDSLHHFDLSNTT